MICGGEGDEGSTPTSMNAFADDSQTMSDRSAAGYSLDAGKNIQVLSDEVDAILSKYSFQELSPASASRVCALLELSRVWCWIDRVESMHDDSITLTDCGVLSMFERHMVSPEGTCRETHPALGAKMFSSSARSSARTVCGWTDTWVPSTREPTKAADDDDDGDDGASASTYNGDQDTLQEVEVSELECIIEECENLDSFERAAAIALWHGNIELAVEVLRRNIDAESLGDETAETKGRTGWNADMTPEYLQLISLVAMCFAGYTPGVKPAKNAWSSMCLHVLAQLQGSKRQATWYLVTACRFLLDTLQDVPDPKTASGATPVAAAIHLKVVDDDKLYLEDRIAFACSYLSDEEVVKWLSDVANRCKKSGSCEGLLVTGLSSDGLDILQQYLDVHADIQTAALLVGRTVEKLPPSSSQEEALPPPLPWKWLFEYRNLLNRWQMFVERACLDVELGKLQRQRPDRNRSSSAVSLQQPREQDSSIDGSAHGSTQGSLSGGGGKSQQQQQQQHSMRQQPPSSAPPPIPGSRGGAQVDRKTSLNRTMYTLPAHSDFPHVYLRCHYCSSSLPVDAMQQQNTAFLRKQRPIINFCPNCKKPLPKCYVCQLYVGLVNPHAEVSRVLARGASQKDDNVLAFGRWLFFCQRCKHGGHAACVASWFGGEGGTAARDVCGVNSCNCRCHDV